MQKSHFYANKITMYDSNENNENIEHSPHVSDGLHRQKKQATEEGGNIKGKQVTSTSIKSDSAALDVQDAENISSCFVYTLILNLKKRTSHANFY